MYALPVPFHIFRAASQLQILPLSPGLSLQVCSCQKHMTLFTKGMSCVHLKHPKTQTIRCQWTAKHSNFQEEHKWIIIFGGASTRSLLVLKMSSRILHPAKTIFVHPRVSQNPTQPLPFRCNHNFDKIE